MMKRLFLSFLFVACCAMRASAGIAELSVFYIPTHEVTGPTMHLRNTMEDETESSHEDNRDAAAYQVEQSDSLGFYYHAFHWVDIVYSSLKFGFNVYNTANIAYRRIDAIIALLNDYTNYVTKKGGIFDKHDKEIFKIGQQLYSDLKTDAEGIAESVGALIGTTAVVKFPITTYSFLECLRSMNEHLDHMQFVLNAAYNRLYFYILGRMGWHWHQIYEFETRDSTVVRAIRRWRASTIASLEAVPKNALAD